MDDYGIKPEWAKAWQWAHKFGHGFPERDLANLALGLLAGWMRERFEREHRLIENSDYCLGCREFKSLDPRHNFDAAAWDRAAREYLGSKNDEQN